MRNKKSEKTFEADLRYPINIEKSQLQAGDCFGKEWDMSSEECPICADRDICGIVFKDLVDKKAKEIEKGTGSKFLDTQDFDAVSDDVLSNFVESGVTTSKELVEFIGERAKTSDIEAIKFRIKSWVKNSNFKIKDGIVWKRN